MLCTAATRLDLDNVCIWAASQLFPMWAPTDGAQVLALQDVSVMSATLCAVHQVSARDPQPFKHLVPSLLSILKQVWLAELAGELMPRAAATLHPASHLVAAHADVRCHVLMLQVAEHRLPKGFDYHKTPAPFIQVSIH